MVFKASKEKAKHVTDHVKQVVKISKSDKFEFPANFNFTTYSKIIDWR